MNDRLASLRRKVKTDILGISANERIQAKGKTISKNEKDMLNMVHWVEQKKNPSKQAVFVNKDGSMKTPAQQQAEISKLQALKRKNDMKFKNMLKQVNKSKNKPQSASQKLATKLVNQTIHSSTRNKAYNELLSEWADLYTGTIIKEDDELKDAMKDVMDMDIDEEDRAKYKIIFKLHDVYGEEADDEIKNKLMAPIINKAKNKALMIAKLFKLTSRQLKEHIKLIKYIEMKKAEKEHGL
jgi:hypothetical protein